MPALRRCLDCPALIEQGPRCPRCTRPVERARTQAKRQVRPYTNAERVRRAEAVDRWRAEHGDWCPGWRRPAHPATDLTADHVVAVGAGGSEQGSLAVLCRRCNGTKQHAT